MTTSTRFGVALVAALTLMVGACTSPPSASVNTSIRQAAESLRGDDGLIRAPEAESASNLDLYLTAVAMDMLSLPPASQVRSDDVARARDLPSPWGGWTVARALGGTPEAPVALPAEFPIPAVPAGTGDDDADAVMLWAWLDMASRLQRVAAGDLAQAHAKASGLRSTRTWYGTWKLHQASTIAGVAVPRIPELPIPDADTPDIAFEMLGYLSMHSSEPMDTSQAKEILRRDLDWPVCSVESLAAARAMSILGDREALESRLAGCRDGAVDGVLLNKPVRLGNLTTTFAVAELLNDDFVGLVSPATLDALDRELNSEKPNEANRTERLKAIAVLHLSRRPIDAYRPELDQSTADLAGRHPVSEAPKLAQQVAPLRRILGLVTLPALVVPRETDLTSEAAIFLLANSDRFSNGEALAAALPRAQRAALDQAMRPEPSVTYYRSVAALPAAVTLDLSEDQQARVSQGLGSLRGCDLSPYLFRVMTRNGQPERCSFTVSVLARNSSFEGHPR